MLINKDLLPAISYKNAYNTSNAAAYSCALLNGETLYYNVDGTTEYPVRCSSNISDYKHIEITYSTPRTYGIYTMRFDVDIALAKGISLFGISGSSAKDRSYMHYGDYVIDGKKITFISGLPYPQFQIVHSTGAITYENSSMKIFKVVGYRY